MTTYLLLNVAMVCILAFLLREPLRQFRHWRVGIVGLIATVLLTAIFDNLIIRSGIVGYDTGKILGIYIGKAPIEDFFYAVVAALTGPIILEYIESREQ